MFKCRLMCHHLQVCAELTVGLRRFGCTCLPVGLCRFKWDLCHKEHTLRARFVPPWEGQVNLISQNVLIDQF
jgi:hypothetical protein